MSNENLSIADCEIKSRKPMWLLQRVDETTHQEDHRKHEGEQQNKRTCV